MNIPNSLTLLRIMLIPVFALAFYAPIPWAHQIAAIIFTFAAITDWLDGYLARRLHQTSLLGAFLDPVADKLMIAVVLVILLQSDPTILLALPVAIIIGREITISALREWMAELGARKKVAVSIMGKVKTFAQMTSLILMTWHDPIGPLNTYEIGFALLGIAAILTLWSMINYLYAAWPELSSRQ